MPPKKTADQQTLLLIEEIKRRKSEIASIQKPSWKTSCQFVNVWAYPVETVNLHVESSVERLVSFAAFLLGRDEQFNLAIAHLELPGLPETKWCGFTTKEWLHDIKARISKLQVGAKTSKLEQLEDRLNKIVSPELRAQMELQAIQQDLERCAMLDEDGSPRSCA